jgi:hypothetical protein
MRATDNHPPLVMNIERRYFAEILSIPRRKKVEYRQLTKYWLTRLERVGPTPFRLRLMNGMLPPVPEATIMVEKIVKRKASGMLELHLGQVKTVKHWDRKRERPAR